MKTIPTFILFIFLLIPCVSSADPFIKHFKESYYMNKYSNFIKKTNDGYEIIAKNGTKITLKNNEGNPNVSDTHVYSFSEYLEDIDYLSFYISQWEYASFLMVNLKNGKQLEILDGPEISPDKKRLFSGRYNENDTEIRIYKITANGIELEWAGHPITHRFSFHSWDGNDVIKLNGVSEKFEAGGLQEHPMAQLLVFKEDSWKIILANQDEFPVIKTEQKPIYTEEDIEKLRSDEKLAFYYVKESIEDFQYVSNKLKDNEEFVKKALSLTENDDQKLIVLESVSDRLLNGQYKDMYEGLVFKDVVGNPLRIKYFPDKFKDNEKFIEKVLATPELQSDLHRRYLFDGISDRLKNGYYKEPYQNLVMQYVTKSQDCEDFKYIEDALKDNEEFVKKVLSNCKQNSKENVLEYTSDRLKKLY